MNSKSFEKPAGPCANGRLKRTLSLKDSSLTWDAPATLYMEARLSWARCEDNPERFASRFGVMTGTPHTTQWENDCSCAAGANYCARASNSSFGIREAFGLPLPMSSPEHGQRRPPSRSRKPLAARMTSPGPACPLDAPQRRADVSSYATCMQCIGREHRRPFSDSGCSRAEPEHPQPNVVLGQVHELAEI